MNRLQCRILFANYSVEHYLQEYYKKLFNQIFHYFVTDDLSHKYFQ